MNGKRLKQAREAANLTQEALGQMLGTNARQIWRWESGANIPNAAKVHEIAQALGVSSDYLLGFDRPLDESDLSPMERRVLEAFRRGDIRAIIRLMPDEPSEPGNK